MFDTPELRAQVPGDVPDAYGSVALPAPGPQPVHLLDRLNAVFRHRRLAGVAFALVVTAMMVQTYSTIPVYQAFSKVQIQDERTTQVGNLNANDPLWEVFASGEYRVHLAKVFGRRALKLARDRASCRCRTPPPRGGCASG